MNFLMKELFPDAIFLDAEEGERLYYIVAPYLNEGTEIVLDFTNIMFIRPNFVAHFSYHLYHNFSSQQLNTLIEVNSTEHIKELFRSVTQQIKRNL